MPSNISLAFYSIRIENRQNSEVVLTDTTVGDETFFTLLEKAFTSLTEPSNHEESKRVTWVEDTQPDQSSNTLKGWVRSGNYGYESELFDIETRERETIGANKAQTLPFYFLLKVPKKQTQAILCLERFEGLGVKSALENHLQAYFRSSLCDYRIVINPIVPKALIDNELTNGSIKKIRLVKYKTDHNAENNLISPKDREKEYKTEVCLSPIFRGSVLPSAVRSLLKPMLDAAQSGTFFQLNDFSEFTQLKEMFEITNMEFSNLKIEVSNNGKTRTLDLSDLNKFNAYYDISDNVKIDLNSGHPEFSSIDQLALDQLMEITQTMYGTSDV